MAFERFTAHARQVVVRSQEAARELRHDYIGTEHILLGLLDTPDTVATRVLHQLGFDRTTAEADIAAAVGRGTTELTGHIPFTPRAKRTMDLALREATQSHHTDIGPEHILLALTADPEGVGAKVLAGRIHPVARIRAAVLAAVGQPREATASPTAPWPAGTPATEDTVAAASALAGGAPVGSHHLLEALLRARDSMAARALRELGVDPAAVAAKLDELDPETTTDANPEETAARRMEIRLVDDAVHVILRDPATVAAAAAATELSGGPIVARGPVAGMFVPLWRCTGQLLDRIRTLLEPGDDDSAADTVVRTVLAPRLRA